MPRTIRPKARIAKRRAGATLISYLTPPVANAGLYRGLVDLKASLDRWRGLEPDADAEQRDGACRADPGPGGGGRPCGRPNRPGAMRPQRRSSSSADAVLELEYTLIPHGLHVVGEPPAQAQRSADAGCRPGVDRSGASARRLRRRCWRRITRCRRCSHALDGGYLRPAPGGDLLRTTDVLPTGRNLHGFDPFRIPSAFAVQDGARQAERLLERHGSDGADAAGNRRHRAVGHRQSENRGRPDRAGAVADGRRSRGFDSYGRLCRRAS